MDDVLRLTGRSDDVAITNCLEKVRFFCEHDAYEAYDLVGQRLECETDRFRTEDLDAMNRAMRARSSRKAWAPYIGVPLAILADIPTDVDLMDCTDQDYAAARERLRAYYRAMRVPWITDMAASKMLFLKRPRLVAISDSYVRRALCLESPSRSLPYEGPDYCAERALSVSDAVRSIGKENASLLTWLQVQMSPVRVTKVRILDILIWAEAAIVERHPMWSAAAAARGWVPAPSFLP